MTQTIYIVTEALNNKFLGAFVTMEQAKGSVKFSYHKVPGLVTWSVDTFDKCIGVAPDGTIFNIKGEYLYDEVTHL